MPNGGKGTAQGDVVNVNRIGQVQQYNIDNSTLIPKGFKHSPHLFNQVLKQDLGGLSLPSNVLRYVDDILICPLNLDDCHVDTIKVLSKLAEGGCKASLMKLQYCQLQVEYFGGMLVHGSKSIAIPVGRHKQIT